MAEWRNSQIAKWQNDIKDKSQIKLNDITVPLKSASVAWCILCTTYMYGQGNKSRKFKENNKGYANK